MATGTWQTYAKFLENNLLGNVNLGAGTFRAMLVDSSGYTPNPDADEFIDDGPRANEVTGTNWATDGQATTPTVTIDTANDQVEVEFSDISVATVTLTDGKYAVVYLDSGSDSTSYLVGYVSFDTPLAPTAGTLAITFPAPTFSFDY